MSVPMKKLLRYQEPAGARVPTPEIRFVSLVENGTHVLFGTQVAGRRTGELALAKGTLPWLKPGMLCLADRYFFGFEFWQQARGPGADLLWRVKKNLQLACEKRLADGSYLSQVYPSQYDRRRQRNGVAVRVIEYQLDGVAGAEPLYRLLTTILDHELAPAPELAALYHERWEIETSLDELKTHLRGARIVLRSKTPELVQQEFYGLMMAHFAIRGLMHEAALKADEDPDRLSLSHAVPCDTSQTPLFSLLFPPEEIAMSHDRVVEDILEERVVSSRNRRNPRGVKRKMTSFPVRRSGLKPISKLDLQLVIKIVK